MSDNDSVGDVVSMIKPTLNAIKAGCSLGILGIKSKFNGVVWDMPGEISSYKINPKYEKRPFFLLIIGGKSNVLNFYEEIEKRLLMSYPPEEYNFSFFSTEIVENNIYGLMKNKNKIKMLSGAKETDRLIKVDPKIQQYTIYKGSGGLMIELEVGQCLNHYCPYVPILKMEQKVWRYLKGGKEGQQAWKKIGMNYQLAKADFTAGNLKISLLERKGKWPIDYEVGTNVLLLYFKVIDIKCTGKVNDWFKKWSFIPEDVNDITNSKIPPKMKDKLFPVLYLEAYYNRIKDYIEKEMKVKDIGIIPLAFKKS